MGFHHPDITRPIIVRSLAHVRMLAHACMLEHSALATQAGLVCLLFLLSGLLSPSYGQNFQFPENGPLGGGFGGLSGAASEVTIASEFKEAQAGQPQLLFVTATIAEGWHIYAIDQGQLPDGGGGPTATIIDVQTSDSLRLLGPFKAIEPAKSHVDNEFWTGLEIREHFNQVTWYAPIEIAPGTDLSTFAIQGNVNLQACSNSCKPMNLNFEANLGNGFAIPETQDSTEIVLEDNQSLPNENEISIFSVICYGILGGLILNLMPCVLPVIGLKVLSFAKQGGQSRLQVMNLNLAYVGGILSVFLLLATLAALVNLGLGHESFGWGELNTLTWFKVGMSSLVFAMALSFLGVWEIPIPGFATSNVATGLTTREGKLGAFMMGIFTTLLATPCSGPFLGPVFGYTLSQNPLVIYVIFFSVGLGMSIPYLLIGAMPSLVSWLPKPGAWMDTFKELLGFVLLATVVWLFSSLNPEYIIPTLTLLIGIWFACWWIGRAPLTGKGRTTAWMGGVGVATLVGIAAFGLMTPGKSVLPWTTYSPEALVAARAEGKTVLVDFTANWCLTCKTNLKLAINREQVQKRVAENGVVPMLADWTNRDDTIKEALRELGSRSIPLLAIYPADKSREVIVLPDLLTQKKVLDALDAAGPSLGQGTFAPSSNHSYQPRKQISAATHADYSPR